MQVQVTLIFMSGYRAMAFSRRAPASSPEHLINEVAESDDDDGVVVMMMVVVVMTMRIMEL